MSHLPELLQRNARSTQGHQSRPIAPAMNAVILSCLDARVDPAHFVRLEPGDAVVIRNAGGRVTADVEQQLAMLSVMARQFGLDPLELIIVHHTDCGMERLADPNALQRMSKASGVPSEALDALAIHDHKSSLATDLNRLHESELVPPGLRVTGLIYDHTSGKAEVVFSEETR